ncbi:type II and III secretion system protein family protein [Phenylobacterium sp. J426]|uniref:type II and III secretion system protein family protein n=1 Tax=Phenylobacterium sp. J426 TaxID=2898439 RepID=UPI0021518A7D|nr:type II and III secretion system protein family protein [Phenylobacterium sp. J426]MCR5874498.1 type II and III secretion system protein family protein [Phenylobacterium sp. J426]
MLMTRTLLGAMACAFALASAVAALPSATLAQELQSESALRRSIHVPRDKSLSFRLGQPAARIVVAQPEIAKVTATSDRSFYVQGLEFGSTNMLVFGPGGRLQEVLDIRVGYDADGLQQDLAAAFPNEPLRVRNLGEALMLTGEVSDTGVQYKAEAIAHRYAPDGLISRVSVRASQQVILEVRVLEATRSALQDLGIRAVVGNNSWAVGVGNGLIGASPAAGAVAFSGGWGNVSLEAQLTALEEKGVIRTLARPNLVAIPGQTATFHAGGEYPYPVPQRDDLISLEFRKYGVALAFMPVVQDNGLIRLEVEPEVSQLDFTNSLRVQGFTVPGLIVRKTHTTVELKDGQSLAIGGLFQREYTNALRQVPGVAEVPVLGALFRSSRWKKAETELIVIVTPRFATQADLQKAAATHWPPGREPTAGELILDGKGLDKPITQDGVQ